MENTKTEFPTIVDDAPVAEFDWLGAFNNSINDNNNYNNNCNDEFNSIINGTYNNSLNSVEKTGIRTIVDDAPIASEWVPSPFPIFSQNNEKIEVKKKKIFPFEIEDLRERYNYYRFPERIRREPRVLKKYNYLANCALVIIYLLFDADRFVNNKSRLTYYANIAHEIIDAPVNSLKAKISQLERWYTLKNNPKISYGLINAYYDIGHMDPLLLWNIIKNHDTLDAETEIKKLIEKDKQC